MDVEENVYMARNQYGQWNVLLSETVVHGFPLLEDILLLWQDCGVLKHLFKINFLFLSFRFFDSII